MDIADFLHLQAALHADGIIQAPSDKKDVACIRIFAGEPLDAFFVVQCLLNLFRQSSQFLDQFSISLFTDQPFHKRRLNGDQIHGDQLCAVGFCRCHGNLRSRISIKDIIALPGYTGTDHVDHAQHRNPLLLCQPQSRKTVGRLAGL